MTKRIYLMPVAVWAAGLAIPSAVMAAPLRVDCKAAMDQFTNWSQAQSLPFTASGTISVLNLHSDEYMPSATFRISSRDDVSSVGFTVSAGSDDADILDLELIEKDHDDVREHMSGHVKASQPVPFSFAVKASGAVSIVVGTRVLSSTFYATSDTNLVMTCTSGHFLISGETLGVHSSVAADKP